MLHYAAVNMSNPTFVDFQASAGEVWVVRTQVVWIVGSPNICTWPDHAHVLCAFGYETTHPREDPSVSKWPCSSYSLNVSPAAELYVPVKLPVAWLTSVIIITDLNSFCHLLPGFKYAVCMIIYAWLLIKNWRSLFLIWYNIPAARVGEPSLGSDLSWVP